MYVILIFITTNVRYMIPLRFLIKNGYQYGVTLRMGDWTAIACIFEVYHFYFVRDIFQYGIFYGTFQISKTDIL